VVVQSFKPGMMKMRRYAPLTQTVKQKKKQKSMATAKGCGTGSMACGWKRCLCLYFFVSFIKTKKTSAATIEAISNKAYSAVNRTEIASFQ